MTYCLLSWETKPFHNRVNFKGNTLLLKERIIYLKVDSYKDGRQKNELLPLKVYPCTLRVCLQVMLQIFHS